MESQIEPLKSDMIRLISARKEDICYRDFFNRHAEGDITPCYRPQADAPRAPACAGERFALGHPRPVDGSERVHIDAHWVC